MIRDIVSDIISPHSSFGDRFLAALMALVMLLVSGLVALLGFVLVDSVGITPTKTATTVVEAKQVVSAYTTTVLMGKVFVPQYYPESYQVHFRIDGEELSPTIEKKFFDDIRVGDRIEVDYGFGRLSNSRQPTQIRKGESP